MSRKRYRDDIRLNDAKLEVVVQATRIAETALREGDRLSLRQLYYQFVSEALLPNRDAEYKRLGSIINDARWAGLFDWSYITDRGRNVRGGDGDDTDPRDVLEGLGFYAALWEGQSERIEVWVEKDALIEVVGRACSPLRVPYFSCRGYTSSSEIKVGAERIEEYLDTDDVEHVTILHLGDHDPSGIDMTRDITTRLGLILDGDGYDVDAVEIRRIALNMDQIQRYNPPPNPAKVTDSRARDYVARFGTSSWELDALPPRVLRTLITEEIRSMIAEGPWLERKQFEDDAQATLTAFGAHYDRIHEFLEAEGLLETPEAVDDDESE